MSSPGPKRRRVALVLSGGGARGAYEAGVLCNLLPRMAALGFDFDILVATSVGSLNACALAATAHYPGEAGAELRVGLMRRAWEAVESDRIFSSRFIEALILLPLHISNVKGPHPGEILRPGDTLTNKLKRALSFKHYHFPGVLDSRPLLKTLRDGSIIDWEQLRENISRGTPSALALSATSVRTGETVCFTQSASFQTKRHIADEHLTLLPSLIGPKHALASAAIPFLFPPVHVTLPDGSRALFVDGGIRQNTPLLPALLLGADSILAIGLQAQESSSPSVEPSGLDIVPVAGKILNAFFLDRVRTDFDRVQIMNKLIHLADPAALAELNRQRAERGKDSLREIRAFEVTPSRDIGELTAELWEEHPELHRPPWRWMFDARGLQGSALGDLMSYIFFHPAFATALMDLGAKDAARTLSDEQLRWLGGIESSPDKTPLSHS